jgi:hypothetical protein
MLDSGFGYFRTRLCVTLCKHHFPMRSSVAPPATATVLSRCRDTQVYKFGTRCWYSSLFIPTSSPIPHNDTPQDHAAPPQRFALQPDM